MIALPTFRGCLARASSGSSYLIAEDCESTGTPSGWADSGTVNWDSTAVVLDGTQSVTVGPTSLTTSPPFAAQTDVWAYCMFRLTSTPGFEVRPLISFNAAAIVRIGASLAPTAVCGSAVGSAGAAISLNTTYHCWAHYVAGTGANGTMEIYISTTGIRPSVTSSTAVGTSTASVTNLIFNSASASTGSKIFDKIRVSSTAIGDNPS